MSANEKRRHAPASSTRKRAAHLGPERRRPQVLDAALELFLEHGYEGTSMEAVARRRGGHQAGRLRLLSGQGRALPGAARPRGGADPGGDPGRLRRHATSSDPETALIEGFTAFLRAVAASPDVYRLIFLGEGGGNAAIAHRIQRGPRGAGRGALTLLARGWLEARDGKRNDLERHRPPARQLDRRPRRVRRPPAALRAQNDWTPETLGRELGRIASAAQAAA